MVLTNVPDIVEQLRARRTTRWIHRTGETPQASGVVLDEVCEKAADEIERLRTAHQALLEVHAYSSAQLKDSRRYVDRLKLQLDGLPRRPYTV